MGGPDLVRIMLISALRFRSERASIGPSFLEVLCAHMRPVPPAEYHR